MINNDVLSHIVDSLINDTLKYINTYKRLKIILKPSAFAVYKRCNNSLTFPTRLLKLIEK